MVALAKAEEGVDPGGRLEAEFEAAERALMRRYVAVVASIQASISLGDLERLIASGQTERALRELDEAARAIASEWVDLYTQSARSTSNVIEGVAGGVVDFDATNVRAVSAMQNSRLRLIREFTEEQRAAVRSALAEGIAGGINPRQQALAFRNAIGLTRFQIEAVANYRRLLETGSAGALERALRDRRFDPSVAAAVAGRRSLEAAQIERMVERYRERYLAHRAETIARTEALRSVHEGAEEMFQQAIERGVLDPRALVRSWFSTRDTRTRDSHRSMQGQKRPIGVPFVSGAGYLLRWPGDLQAPASETINCRCSVTTRFRALPGGFRAAVRGAA
jgi:hypothetical protein